ncbi:MAG TPA: hypothetical protein VJ787_11485, partial [Thermoleophilia bacterium]|nr:hypothetical protein [Thermoleophilia bacterium]
TIGSVLEAVARAKRDGIGPTLGWTGDAWDGEEAISERTLRRWCHLVQKRLIGGALSWLGPRMDLLGPATLPEAPRLLLLLDRLDSTLLLGFRARFGRAVLDCVPSPPPPPRSGARRVPGRLAEASPPDPPTQRLARGQRLRRAGRNRSGRDPPRGGEA